MAEPVASITLGDSSHAGSWAACSRSLASSCMPAEPEYLCGPESRQPPQIARHSKGITPPPVPFRVGTCPGRVRGAPTTRMKTRPAPPPTSSPGNGISAARPWPSVKSRRCHPTAGTVHADRRNCACRPSLQPGRPSAMRPWTPRHDGPQRDKVTHTGTQKKRPASARIRSKRGVFAGGGRCWVRTNVG